MIEQDSRYEDKYLRLEKKLEQLPNQVERGVIQIKMESKRIKEVMKETVAQMTMSLSDGEQRLHKCERKIQQIQDATAKIKILDNDVQ